jgi:hypothetical protein
VRLHRAIFLGAGIIGAGIVAISVTIKHTRREPAGVAARLSVTPDPIATLQREVDALKEKIQRPQVVLRSADKAPEEKTTIASPLPDPASKPTNANDQASEIAEMLESHHTSEPLDRAWSDKLHAELGAAVSLHPGTTISSTECAASLCRVTLLHETVQAQNELAFNVAALPGLSAGVFYHYESDQEPPRTVLYVVREGHDMREMLVAR